MHQSATCQSAGISCQQYYLHVYLRQMQYSCSMHAVCILIAGMLNTCISLYPDPHPLEYFLSSPPPLAPPTNDVASIETLAEGIVQT